MSAFVCNEKHITALALYAASYGQFNCPRVCYHQRLPEEKYQIRTLDLANFYANIFYQQNLKSVQYRYQHEYPTIQNLIHKQKLPEKIEIKSIFFTPILKPLEVLKMIRCLEYQSCETPDWEETESYKILQRLKNVTMAELPGYDDAPWELV